MLVNLRALGGLKPLRQGATAALHLGTAREWQASPQFYRVRCSLSKLFGFSEAQRCGWQVGGTAGGCQWRLVRAETGRDSSFP